jgi:SWI/SNF-related matrix-associated actin-dependent regulator of chromatin subfamily B protein 1
MGKTYGEKPIVFRFEENGEEYMIGSEVGNYLRLFRGALYKKYPGLVRRMLSNDERRRLIEMGHSQHVTSSTISLLLAKARELQNGVISQLLKIAERATVLQKNST